MRTIPQMTERLHKFLEEWVATPGCRSCQEGAHSNKHTVVCRKRQMLWEERRLVPAAVVEEPTPMDVGGARGSGLVRPEGISPEGGTKRPRDPVMQQETAADEATRAVEIRSELPETTYAPVVEHAPVVGEALDVPMPEEDPMIGMCSQSGPP